MNAVEGPSVKLYAQSPLLNTHFPTPDFNLFSREFCRSPKDEELLRRERELRDLSAKLESTHEQLDDFKRRRTATAEEVQLYKEKEARWEGDRRALQVRILG